LEAVPTLSDRPESIALPWLDLHSDADRPADCRRRDRRSAEFKASVIQACMQSIMSIAAVALANNSMTRSRIFGVSIAPLSHKRHPIALSQSAQLITQNVDPEIQAPGTIPYRRRRNQYGAQPSLGQERQGVDAPLLPF
jgi:hypothetical protein